MNDLKLCDGPSVYIVGRQVIDEAELGRFLAANDVDGWETDTDIGAQKLVETAGRACYMSFAKPRPGGNAAYIGHILEVGHGSVCEHAVFSLLIEGVSRSLTHELVRHRAGMSYSQQSQRFVDESSARFVVPPLIGEWADDDDDYKDELLAEWEAAIAHARDAYARIADMVSARLLMREMPPETWHDGRAPESHAEMNDVIAGLPPDLRTRIRKRAREAARSVLPNATETKIFVTGNARALRHFVQMRGDLAADAEMRRLAVMVARILGAEAPNLFADVAIVPTADGIGSVYVRHPKV